MLRRLEEFAGRHAGALRGLALALVLAAVLLGARKLPVEQLYAWLTGRVDVLGAWGPLLFGLVFVALTLLILPGTPLVVAAGAAFGPAAGTVLISLASTASAAVGFLAGRHLGREWVAGRVRRRPKLWAVYRALQGAEGWKIVVAVRLSHAMPFGLQNYLFGVTPVRFGTFLLATWVSMLPGTILYTYLGHLGAAALESQGGGAPLGPAGWLVRAAGLAVAAGALLYVAHVARRAVKTMTHVDLDDLGAAGPVLSGRDVPSASSPSPTRGEAPLPPSPLVGEGRGGG